MTTMAEHANHSLCVDPPAVVVSDLHLGSTHCRYDAFLAFLNSWRTPMTLILNGDTLDAPGLHPNPQSEAVLRALQDNDCLRPVVVMGNHDASNPLFAAYGFATCRSVRIPHLGAYICHGDQFHVKHPHHRLFIHAFHTLHRLRVRLGAPPVHVAEYAKRWHRFYGYLRDAVRDNAVEFARENGCRVVVCGHVHCAEDRLCQGVRYINTGCWTEPTAHFLSLRDESVALLPWPPVQGAVDASNKVVGSCHWGERLKHRI